jgi:hypothetical protein
MFIALLSWLDPSLPSTRDHFRTFIHDRLYNSGNGNDFHIRVSVPLRSVAIHHELSHSSTSRAAASFERALAVDACSASAALWRCYIKLCVQRDADRRGRMQPQRPRKELSSAAGKKKKMLASAAAITTAPSEAKDAFYRAVANCPWSRDLMMLAFGPLRGDMDDAELMGAFERWRERGLRIHADLEDHHHLAEAEVKEQPT